MARHLDAYDEPPAVKVVEGEVLLLGQSVCAAYTPEAIEELLPQLVTAVSVAREQATSARCDPARRPRLHLVE